jgi:hypothetical protein
MRYGNSPFSGFTQISRKNSERPSAVRNPIERPLRALDPTLLKEFKR